ncbi:hypothetical protein Clacol_004434 [Clathrus columnatus]|uniref:Uncharacterized protein n=1 Tax=Clathrus columnatus TaxID=1419009 RepID=A0AAV5AAJ5_9AGAM|nr:hypothetical protein Clacol_004434 [Clathrus columnatus]
MTIAISTTFFTALILAIYVATSPTCQLRSSILTYSESITLTVSILTLILVDNVAVVLLEVLAFIAVLYQVWGLWREKRKLGLHTDKDFVTLLLRQGTLRFSFVLFISVTQTIIIYISPTAGTNSIAVQNVLSVILICEFTQDLRRRNTIRSLPNQSSLELPDLNLSSQDNSVRSIQSVFGRFQERMIADMGERNDPVGLNGPGEKEPNQEAA